MSRGQVINSRQPHQTTGRERSGPDGPARPVAPAPRIPRRRTPADTAPPAGVLTASWCCSVGSTWAVVLHQPQPGTGPATRVMWITSGVPISEPVPHSQARELLAQHGFLLFFDPGDPRRGRTRSVRRIGFVSRDHELIRLAQAIQDDTIQRPDHPLALAARWTAAGFTAQAAVSWIGSGILTPQDRGGAHQPREHHRGQTRIPEQAHETGG